MFQPDLQHSDPRWRCDNVSIVELKRAVGLPGPRGGLLLTEEEAKSSSPPAPARDAVIN